LPLTLTTGLLPVRIVAGNINGDGLPDLVVLNVANVDHPLLYLATPQGGFQTPIALSAGSGPTDAALLAGNPMGLDLAIVDQFSPDITLLANQGGGSFGSPVLYRASQGLSEVATVPVSQGQFQLFNHFATRASPSAVVAGDFNHDGVVDIVVTH